MQFYFYQYTIIRKLLVDPFIVMAWRKVKKAVTVMKVSRAISGGDFGKETKSVNGKSTDSSDAGTKWVELNSFTNSILLGRPYLLWPADASVERRRVSSVWTASRVRFRCTLTGATIGSMVGWVLCSIGTDAFQEEYSFVGKTVDLVVSDFQNQPLSPTCRRNWTQRRKALHWLRINNFRLCTWRCTLRRLSEGLRFVVVIVLHHSNVLGVCSSPTGIPTILVSAPLPLAYRHQHTLGVRFPSDPKY
jgi:hypothetical protein